MRYCSRCVTPDSRPQIVLDSEGVCNACRSHEAKSQVDWTSRERDLRELIHWARKRSSGYDCVIPVSGGKDSTWQVVTCLEYGLNPLCVTWKPPARTELGARNLQHLIDLGVDHVDYSISPIVERKFILAALERFGAPALPMHLAIFHIPLRLAVALQIPLIVWGENSAVEYGTTDDRFLGFKMDAAWVERFGVTHGTTARDWMSETLSEPELTAYFGPSEEDLERAGVQAVFLGHYLPWDPKRSLEVARRHGFESGTSPRTGIYSFADIDDDFISVHHYLKWFKFGLTRSFDNLSLEIRNGRVTREQAIAELARRGDETPHDDIAKMCVFLGIARERFWEIAERFRNHDIWTRRDGAWVIEDFLIDGWGW